MWVASVSVFLALLGAADAAPPRLEVRQSSVTTTASSQPAQSSSPFDSGNNSSSITAQIWVPVIVVAIMLIGTISVIWKRRGVMNRMRRMRLGITGNNGTAHELTADQLAGRSGTTPTNNATTGNAGTRPRTRRPRRTPSQISTTSLPVYNKEPGDQELVIFRGPDDEDMPMPTVDETANDNESEEDQDGAMTRQTTREMTEAPHYSPRAIPFVGVAARDRDTTADAHLHASSVDLGDSTIDLQAGDESAYGSTMHLMPESERSVASFASLPPPSSAPPNAEHEAMARTSEEVRITGGERNDVRPSSDSANSGSGESASRLLMQPNSPPRGQNRAHAQSHGHTMSDVSAISSFSNITEAHLLAPRGEAPPYWEVVGQDDGGMGSMGAPMTDSPVQESAAPVSGLPVSVSAPGMAPSTSQGSQGRRKSAFRNFFGTFVPGHGSTSSSSSATASSSPSVPPPPPSGLPNGVNPRGLGHSRHRASQSGGGGFGSGSGSHISLPLAPWRTLTHQRSSATMASSNASSSNLNLNGSATNLALTRSRSPTGGNRNGIGSSPSTLSLSSLQISAPLPHTLTKTEIRYPKGGPTPEQIKILSSRESLTLGRFALPYGRAAEEASASMSRLGLGGSVGEGEEEEEEGALPPSFEDVAGGSGGSGAGAEGRDASDATVHARSRSESSNDVGGTQSTSQGLSTIPASPNTSSQVQPSPLSAQSPTPTPTTPGSTRSRASTTATFATAVESFSSRTRRRDASSSPSPPSTPMGPVIRVLPGSRPDSPEVGEMGESTTPRHSPRGSERGSESSTSNAAAVAAANSIVSPYMVWM
ncbi:hypothetical protein BD410DRAFT_792107 [Rickenella mellea]|uniref:Proteophosphoglycan ppg4 n=1 Tax=Rickenella mellea TaxID=50990 RepID=A0A4Y7PWQ0_9AGAM|nr:hypothetical protein BD410DRAFT_792107 [Rickenella mellea]